MMQYEKGELLIPHEDFIMDTGERCFTEGMVYIVIAVRVGTEGYLFVDDQEDEHLMSENDIAGWLIQL